MDSIGFQEYSRVTEVMAGDPGGSRRLSTSDLQNPDRAGWRGSAIDGEPQSGVLKQEFTRGSRGNGVARSMEAWKRLTCSVNLPPTLDLHALALGRACMCVTGSKMRLEV